MKKHISLFISMMMLFLFACSVNEEIVPDPSSQSGDLKCHYPKGEVFTVNPSGGDDTQALSDAFDAAKAAGPGSTVQMVEGQYTIGMIEVRDFDGYFKGAGRGKTIISNLSDLPCEELISELNLTPALLRFTGGNVTISDLTFQLNEGNPCAPGDLNDQIYGELTSILVLADYSATHVPENRYIKGVVNKVDFIGGNDGGAGVYGTPGNVAMPLYIGVDFMLPLDPMPLSHINITLTNCYFELGLVGPDVWSSDENSILYIANNILNNNSLAGVFLGFCLGSNCTVINNQFQNTASFADLYIDNNDYGYYSTVPLPVKKTKFTISGNKFQSLPGAISMYLSDYLYGAYEGSNIPQIFNITGNTINTQEGGIGIIGVNFMDAKIWNNRLSGSGAIGVMLDGTEATNTWAENNKIMANNFTKATYTDAAVLLGSFTKNCTVVGVASDLVVDLGVNNKVIGVKAQKKGPHYQWGSHGHLKSMHENMMRMRSMKPQS